MRVAAYAALPLLISAAPGAQFQDVQLRLESPLASYSRPGTSFTARITGPASYDRPSLLPAGTLVRGVVRQAHSIGLGVRRERAGLTLEFEGCELPTGQAAECDVRLLAVDNARETVRNDNRIQGMLAASHPPRFLSGLWYRPSSTLLLRPVSGLMGAGGMICKRMAPGPLGAAIMISTRLIFFRIPDPEIELPPGTDLLARLSVPDEHYAEPLFLHHHDGAWPPGFLDWLGDQSRETTRADGQRVADEINMAFLASEADLTAAFTAAGWEGADALTGRTFAKTYSAFIGMKSYPRAPVSMIHYQKRSPDLVFQKSFNTLSRRHHIRLWKVERPAGGVVWLGAATHDVGLVFDWNRMNLTHRIDLNIDRERSKVTNDLSAVSCLSAMVATPHRSQRKKFRGEAAVTDGAVWAAQLQPCQAAPPIALALLKPNRSRAALSVRRVVLESRYYLTRGNAYHFAYESVRWAFFGRNDVKSPLSDN